MNRSTYLTAGAAVAALAVVAATATSAEPPSSNPIMARALVKAAQGPTELRRYVERTKPIYNLDYTTVAAAHEAQRMAATAPRDAEPTRMALAGQR